MAALVHWVLQQPDGTKTVFTAPGWVKLLVWQLQLLVEDASAAAATKADQPLTRRQQQLQSKKQLKQGGKQAKLQQVRGVSVQQQQQGSAGTAQPVSARQQAWEQWLPAAFVGQVGCVTAQQCYCATVGH
jgi:hypothetical protein